MIAPNPVQIVVVGAGLIGPRHAQHIVQNHNCELFAIIDPIESSRQVAHKYGTDHFSSVAEMVNYCDSNGIAYPQGAIVCTPNHTHIKVSAELISFGIHVLVEKPVSLKPGEAKALKAYAYEKNVKVLVGHHRRFNPYILEAKNNLDRIGNVVALQGSWALRKPDEYYEISPWRTDTKTGGGVLLIKLIHDLDLLQYLFGGIQKVYAEPLKKQRKQYPNVDEGAALTIKFENGIIGTFVCSDNVTSPFNFESGTGENPTIPHFDTLEGFYRIFGTKGTLSVPDLNLYHQPGTAEGSWLEPITKSAVKNTKELRDLKPFDLQLNHFIDVIRGKAESLCSIDDGISALLCIEAVMTSVDTGMPQFLRDPKHIQSDFSSLGVVTSL